MTDEQTKLPNAPPMSTSIPGSARLTRGPLPNLRGEDETELSFLSSLIETQAWVLCPQSHPSCVVGRHPEAPEDEPKFCASIYGLSKNNMPALESSLRFGRTRKEALTKLLVYVETEIGQMMLNDREGRRREERGRNGNGGSGN